MPTYRDLGFLTCGGSISYDNLDSGIEGLFNGPQFIQFWYMWLEHGEVVTFTFDYRIHQPTVDYNNNTQAIWDATFFDLNLEGTPSGDHGDFVGSRTYTYYNSSPNDSEPSADGDHYLPGRYIRFEQWNTFGAMEFTYSASSCVELPAGPGHVTVPGPDPSVSTRISEGGWNVGHA